MSSREFKLGLVFLGILLMVFIRSHAQNLQLYTTYPKISVSPGEIVDYNVELINDGATTGTSDLLVSNLPKDWDYSLKSGNYTVGAAVRDMSGI